MVDLLFAFMQVKCFFLWVDDLVQMLMHELLEMHGEWLPILPQIAAAAARAPAEETEVAIELGSLNQKIRKLEEAQISNYVWVFLVGMVIAVVVMFKLYGKA
jgi:hypothetical protein